MSTTSLSERNQYTDEGQVAYLYAGSGPGLQPVNRLYDSAIPDHRDCTCTSLPGYSGPVTLGYSASASGAALTPLTDGNLGNDFATWGPNTQPAGYSAGDSLGYAFPRYGMAQTSLLTLAPSGGNVSVASNLVTGGSLWNWTDNGFQYIDDYGAGRLIQSAVFWLDSSASALNDFKYTANPTEGGAGAGCAESNDPPDVPGSPVLSASDPGGPTGTTQSTRTIPLEWNTTVWGGSCQQPPIWSQMQLGKDLTLDYDGIADDVAQYTTWMYSPTTLTPKNNLTSTVDPTIQIPAAFFPASSFTNFYDYDPTTETLTPHNVAAGATNTVFENFSSGYHGVIISDSTGAHAFGIYGVAPGSGGSVDQFCLANLSTLSQSAGPTMGLCANYFSGTALPAGWSHYNSYLMSGSLTSVQSDMNQLYAKGAK